MHPILFLHEYLTQRQPNPGTQRITKRRDGLSLRRWLSAAARQWQRGRMNAALEAMDDRLLRDIGIYRSDIWRVVDGLSDRELRMAPLAPSADPVETYDDIYRKAA